MRSPDRNSPKFSLAEKTLRGLQNWNCGGAGASGVARGGFATYPVVLVGHLGLRRREAVDLEPDALAGPALF